MNYPVWDVSFGAGLLVAIVSILHVFVSHFAVGGGLFLVLTEKKAYRENDAALLQWLQHHSKFFVLLTVVFGAMTGVGIWFTIGLVHPSGTSSLIHTYVWGWAIEWVFFFLEITAALMYLYGWKKLDRNTHLWIGWIYFIAAFLSMVIINGIITFMLTSGKWIETRFFWHGFFNPTYFPSLFLRFCFALALAGLYALLTGSLQASPDLKAKVVRWSVRWIVPAFIVIPLFAYWYIHSIPGDVWEKATGRMPTATYYAHLILIFSIVTFVLAIVSGVLSRRLPFVLSLVVLGSAFITMWSFEFIRESIRKPFIIFDYMYVNGLYAQPFEGAGKYTVENANRQGILQTANWVSIRNVTAENVETAGREIFRVECQSCHTLNSYRGLVPSLKKRVWNFTNIRAMLGSLDQMHNGVMPPFAGTETERDALARFLASLVPENESLAQQPVSDGKTLFNRYCQNCHIIDPEEDSAFLHASEVSADSLAKEMTDLPALVEEMPDLNIPEQHRITLAKWMVQQAQTPTK